MNFYSLLGLRCSVRTLAGFLLTGFLFASPGAWLPVWGYHIQTDYVIPGIYFFCLSAGIVAAVEGSRLIKPPLAIARLRWMGCAMACGALLPLGALPPTGAVWGRMLAFLVIGWAGGMVNMTLFDALTPMYERNPAATATAAGVLFGLGCLLSAVLVAATFNGDSSTALWIVSAFVPGIFAVIYARSAFAAPDPVGAATIVQALREFRGTAGALLAVLIFFQLGSEWSIAGWLPIFLIHRVGMSPETSLILLAVYWLALLAGRVAAFRLLSNGFHARDLFLAAWAALFGCVILLKTDNRFGAWTGILLAAAGFAAITPIIVERIRSCFPDYHPGFFNGVFAFALAGGMLSPALLGFLANSWGIWIVMVLPLFGTALVFLLLFAMWLDRRFRKEARA